MEKASSGRKAANVSAGGCGVEDQVGRTDFHPRSRRVVVRTGALSSRFEDCVVYSPEVVVDIVLKSRHLELTDRFRDHVEEKLARLEKHDHRVIRVEVEVDTERNPRLQDRAIRVELTAFSPGPVIRAEAAAEDEGE